MPRLSRGVRGHLRGIQANLAIREFVRQLFGRNIPNGPRHGFAAGKDTLDDQKPVLREVISFDSYSSIALPVSENT